VCGSSFHLGGAASFQNPNNSPNFFNPYRMLEVGKDGFAIREERDS